MSNDIKYFLIAEVDGQTVYSGEFPDSTLLQESIYKAEISVERELREIEESTDEN